MDEVDQYDVATACREGASALLYRAERLRGLAGDDKEAVEMIQQWRDAADILARLAGIAPGLELV